jgi:dolichol-phosphate mannosyltransferase
MSCTIVIPTYNEAANLPNLVRSLFALPVSNLKLLIVDDGSPDGTGDIAEGLKVEYPGKISVLHRPGKQGLGTAYIQGFKLALENKAHTIVQMDADLSHPPIKLIEMQKTLETCDVVVGSRYVHGGQLDKTWPLWRKGLSGFGNLYSRVILGLTVRDNTAGFRMWRRETLKGMPLDRIQSNGYAFQVEMTYVATKLGYLFKEIPIYFLERQHGDSKMSVHIQIEAAIRVWQLLWDYRDIKPNLKQ